MVPMIVVTGLVALGSSSSSIWLFNSNYYPWVSSAPFSGNLNLSAALSPPKEDRVRLDLRWRVVGGGEREEACSDELLSFLWFWNIQASNILLDDKFEVRLGSLSEVCVQEGDTNQNRFTRLLRLPLTPNQGTSVSERELENLKHVLMLLSEAEKHLRVSSEKSTWFTATFLQLGSIPSPDRTQLGSSRRQSFKTNDEHHIHTFREATTHKQRSDAANFNPGGSQSINYEALAIRYNDFLSGNIKSRYMNTNTLIDIWVPCVEKCHSRTLRHLLYTYGKLMSISEV